MNFEEVTQYIQMITLLLPLVQQVILMVENAFTGQKGFDGRSEMKKNIAVEVVKGFHPELAVDVYVVSKMIDTIVSVKNASGEFKHSG